MPDGEQVYFGISRDGFHWQSLNGGQPVLWAYYGDKGVRDHTIVRSRYDGRFHIFSTDLSLSYGMRGQYRNNWDEVARLGSKYLAHWQSDDLVNWTEQELVKIGGEDFGCVWAPDIVYDRKRDSYLLHWSSSRADNNYGPKGIFYSYTKDFVTFSQPEVLYHERDIGVIDSAIYDVNGSYYMFLKHESAPCHVRLLRADDVLGPYELVKAFDEEMEKLSQPECLEAPTAIQMEDGRWCLFLDYFGVRGAGQGYVPFVTDSLESGRFLRSDEQFSFPYGYKHGTILEISDEEYNRLERFQWPQN